MDNKIKVGDIIYFLDAKGEGKVLKVNETDATILNEYGFEEVYPLNAILKKNNQNNNQLLNAYIPKKLENDLKKTPIKSIFKKKTQLVWEIDVHIENLLIDYYHLSNYEIISKQLDVCEEMILKAQKMKVRKLVIIHGKGQGVLRNEIHQMLYSFRIDFKDSDYLQYSGGATDIFFR